jgi:hypothetical protein
MFALEENGQTTGHGAVKSGDINSFDSNSGQSLDKVFKAKNFTKKPAQANSDRDFQNKANF